VCSSDLRKLPEVRRVLLATDSSKLSGGSRQLLNNARALCELGVEVHGLFRPGSPLTAEMEGLGARVHACEEFSRPLALGRRIRALVAEHGLDVVHTFHNKAYKGGLAARLPGLLRGRAAFGLFLNRGVIFAPNLLFGLWARIASAVVVNSRACAATLRRRGVPASRLKLVYNSFTADPFPPARKDRDKRGVRVLAVLNEAPAKGLDVFLQAAGLLAEQDADRDMEYVAAGIRKPEPFLRELDHRVLDRLALPGLLAHAEVLDQLMAADLLVIPSRQESLPNVLLEGFAASLPVVVTEAGGMPELVADGVNGRVVPAGDAAALADAVRDLAADPLRRRRMGAINRVLVTTRLDNRTKGLALLAAYHGRGGLHGLDLAALAKQAQGVLDG